MDEEIIQKVREILGEHCPAWAIVCEDAEGNFWHDYSTPVVGRALHDYASTQLSNQLDWGEAEIEWSSVEDDEGDEWKQE